LYSLVEATKYSFDFDFDHAFEFYHSIERFNDSVEVYELFAEIGEESKFKGEKTKVKQAFDKLAKKMLFIFDYGDEWHFIVELEGTESAKGGENIHSLRNLLEMLLLNMESLAKKMNYRRKSLTHVPFLLRLSVLESGRVLLFL
jgi:pRiA4b ORF-3-like protein